MPDRSIPGSPDGERPIGLTLGFAVVVFGFFPTSSNAQTDVAQALIELNRALVETQMLDRDPTFLLENSVDEYVVVAPGGVVENRERVVAGLGAFSRVDSLSLTEDRVTVTGATAVVINRMLVYGEVGIPIEPGPRRAMTVFSRDANGQWKAVSRTVTPCHPRAVQAGLC